MDLKLLYHVPQELGEPSLLLAHETTLVMQYEREGEKRHIGILFEGIAATQVRVRRCAKAWQRKTYYDLVEVFGEPWKDEVLKDVQEEYAAWRAAKHHYAIGGDYDFYEIIADGWKLLPEEDGWLE